MICSANTTSGQGPTTTGDPTDLLGIRELGAEREWEKSILTPTQELEFLGFRRRSCRNSEALSPRRETQGNPAGCQTHAGPTLCVSKGNSEVCRQDHCYHESHPLVPLHYRALQ